MEDGQQFYTIIFDSIYYGLDNYYIEYFSAEDVIVHTTRDEYWYHGVKLKDIDDWKNVCR